MSTIIDEEQHDEKLVVDEGMNPEEPHGLQAEVPQQQEPPAVQEQPVAEEEQGDQPPRVEEELTVDEGNYIAGEGQPQSVEEEQPVQEQLPVGEEQPLPGDEQQPVPEEQPHQEEEQPYQEEEQPHQEEEQPQELEAPDDGYAAINEAAQEEEEKPMATDEVIKQDEDETPQEEETAKPDDLGIPIHEPSEHDVLNGRGASVNAHRGNTRFRALCFARKPEFEAGNHAAKRRVATEIVGMTKALPGRFLKRKQDKGPWYELSTEKSILKACQVMRDFQRPDRLALREMTTANGGRKRQRTSESTPGVNAPPPAVPLAPIVENPYGVHDHDVLSGRGAFVNGHVGNARFRQLATKRKPLFDAGNYSEKRSLATEIVGLIRGLEPPGRFLKRGKGTDVWEELSDDRAIHKACQVMRDLQRPDRTGDRKGGFRNKNKGEDDGNVKEEDEDANNANNNNVLDGVVDDNMTPAENIALGCAVLATEEVLDKALAEGMAEEAPVAIDEEEVKVGAEQEEQKVPVEMMQV